MVEGRRVLAIDIETCSGLDLAKCGVYSYVQNEDFEILLFGYAFEEEEVKVIDLKSGEELPEKVKKALVDPKVIKTAFNANFERTCLSWYLKTDMPPEQWRCTQVMALSLGLPASLEAAAQVLKLKEQKLSEGKKLIKYYGTARKSLSLQAEDRESWEKFKGYCRQDVEVERSLRKQLESYEITDKEQRLWVLDQHINDYGVKVDKELLEKAISCNALTTESIEKELIELTGVKNPNSAAQLKKWLYDNEGLKADSLNKEAVEELLEQENSARAKRVLSLRQELSKTSIKKYEAMKRAMCSDGRVRGLFQFYGANRTGRWAGRLVQVQNLPQNKMDELDLARNLLIKGNTEALEGLTGSSSQVLSQLVRTAFVPEEGARFIAADFSAIEARIIAWLAGEQWRIEVFKAHGKIYEASAAKMFKVPIESIGKDSALRQKGKIAELALGYQGSKGALINMGALKMGLKERELIELVTAWRGANKNIVKLWQQVEMAAVTAVEQRRAVKLQHNLEFFFDRGILFIKLPSGRKLSYINARLKLDFDFNKYIITYEGIDQTNKRWTALKTYGGKLVENIVQAIARDCLAEAMLRLYENGYKIVMHIHDEVVLEVPENFGSLEEVQETMAEPIAWAKGLHLTAEAFESKYYRK